MMGLPESFNLSLAEFGKLLGENLAIVDGRCQFVVDGTVEVELDYLEDVHVVLAWSVIGYAPEDEYQEERAQALLALNELGEENGGFSLAMDPETRRIIAQDHRPAEQFSTTDALAAWIDELVSLVGRVRRDAAERFPVNDFIEEAMAAQAAEEV